LQASRDTVGLKFEELFRTYFTSLCYFAQKYISDLDTSKEIVHGIFVSIWEKREEFDFEKPAKSYLFTSVYNRCMNYLRDQKKFVDNENSEFIPEGGSNYNDHVEAAEVEDRIWKAINQLPEKCREVFILNRFDEKKYRDIAEHLNISVKTVESQMSKALRILRDNLKDYLHLILLLSLIKNLW
jgi:RNA polymerase sigma-70 factor (ECF subfamily)